MQVIWEQVQSLQFEVEALKEDNSRLNGRKKKNLLQNNAILRGHAPDFIGGEAVFQVDMLKVVEVNVLSNQFFDLRTSCIMSTIQIFWFEHTKEFFHGCVIVRTARTGHERWKVVFFTQTPKCRESVLRSLATVESKSIRDLFCDQSIPNRLCNQRSIHVASNAVSQYHSFTKIYGCTHVQHALRCGNISDICRCSRTW